MNYGPVVRCKGSLMVCAATVLTVTLVGLGVEYLVLHSTLLSINIYLFVDKSGVKY